MERKIIVEKTDRISGKHHWTKYNWYKLGFAIEIQGIVEWNEEHKCYVATFDDHKSKFTMNEGGYPVLYLNNEPKQ